MEKIELSKREKEILILSIKMAMAESGYMYDRIKDFEVDELIPILHKLGISDEIRIRDILELC